MILQKGLELSYTHIGNSCQQWGAEIYLMLLHWNIAICLNAESSSMNKIKYIDVFIIFNDRQFSSQFNYRHLIVT